MAITYDGLQSQPEIRNAALKIAASIIELCGERNSHLCDIGLIMKSAATELDDLANKTIRVFEKEKQEHFGDHPITA